MLGLDQHILELQSMKLKLVDKPKALCAGCLASFQDRTIQGASKPVRVELPALPKKGDSK